MDDLTKFLGDFDHTYMDRTRPKGPDYLIIDNFAEVFQLDKTDLIDARSEAEGIKDVACNNQVTAAYERCDYLVCLENLDSLGDSLTALGKIADAMSAFKPVLNEVSQDKLGNKSLRVDE